jgi:hypothetical protein
MTLKKLSIITALLPLLAACSDDNEYVPASQPDNEQVYFAYNERHAVTLEDNQTSFQIPVYRANTQGAIDVPITVSQSDQTGIFTVATTAKFADGESTAYLNVGVDFDRVESAHTYTIDLTIPESYTTPYGASTCSYTVEYFLKGDPFRDLLVGYYEGTCAGGEYLSTEWYYTAMSFDYNSSAAPALRIVPTKVKDQVKIQNLFPQSPLLNTTDVVGTVVLSNEYDGYLGYIKIEPQKVGTVTMTGFGSFELNLGAAWATGSYASEPYDTIEVWVAGSGDASTGNATIESVDFNGMGWVLMFGYQEYGAWYWAAYGGAVVTPIAE